MITLIERLIDATVETKTNYQTEHADHVGTGRRAPDGNTAGAHDTHTKVIGFFLCLIPFGPPKKWNQATPKNHSKNSVTDREHALHRILCRADVAQVAERPLCNRENVGSTPTIGSMMHEYIRAPVV